MEERNEIPIAREDPKELAKTLLAQGASVEAIMGQTTLTKPAILGLKGALIKAQKAQERLTQSQANSKPEIPFQAENEANPDIEGEVDLHSSSTSPKPQQFPNGSVLLEPGDIEAIRKMIPTTHQSTYIAHVDLASKRQSQINRNNGNNGHGFLTNADEDLKRAEAETEREYAKTLRDRRMRERDGNTHESESLKELKQEIRELRQNNKSDPLAMTKMIFDVYKTGVEHASPKGEGDPTALIWKAVDTVEKIQERATSPNARNEYDLKLEEMRGNRELDNRRLDHAERIWEHEKEQTGKTLETVKDLMKEVTSGPIGKLISGAGEGVRDRIRGSNPSLMDVQCPSCSNKFRANRTLTRIMCPNCSALLEARPTVQPEPEPQEPPTQEPQPEPEPQTQSDQVEKAQPTKQIDENVWTKEEREAFRKPTNNEVIQK